MTLTRYFSTVYVAACTASAAVARLTPVSLTRREELAAALSARRNGTALGKPTRQKARAPPLSAHPGSRGKVSGVVLDTRASHLIAKR